MSTTNDMNNFTFDDITQWGKMLRETGKGDNSMEDVTNKIVRYLYDNLIDKQTGMRACSLIRFFKTHSFRKLDDELQKFARRLLGNRAAFPEMKCLVLLSSVGENPAWNSRKNSIGHKAIPLPSDDVVRQAPMILNLIKQLGLAINTVIHPDPVILLDIEQKTYNIFFIPEALNSPHIPAQQEFIISYGIKSVLGFGSILPSGDIFAIIMFLKVAISKSVAELFRPIALNVKLAVLPFENAVFAEPHEAE